MYNDKIEALLEQIEREIAKDYKEELDDVTKMYKDEVVRLNAVIEAYRELLIIEQNKQRAE